ncbi:unnamed protein product, partial [Symbiodinium pilosum]
MKVCLEILWSESPKPPNTFKNKAGYLIATLAFPWRPKAQPPQPASKMTFPKESSIVEPLDAPQVPTALSDFEAALQRLRSLHEQSLFQLQAKLFKAKPDDVACEGAATWRPERRVTFEESQLKAQKDQNAEVVVETTLPEAKIEAPDQEEEKAESYDRIRLSQIDLNNKLMELDQEFARSTGTRFFQIERSEISVSYM